VLGPANRPDLSAEHDGGCSMPGAPTRVVAVDVLRRSDMRRFWVGLKERVS
jgi:hypothetical protein